MAHLSRSRATLRLFGDDLVLAELTRVLGHPSSKEQVKGEVIVGKSSGHKRIAKTGMWRLEAADAEPENLDTQIAEIFGKLTSDLDVWKTLLSRYSIDLFCGLFMEESNEGFSLSAESMKILGLRGIEIGFDLYGPTTDGEEDASRKGDGGIKK
jgi:hypothetical protein